MKVETTSNRLNAKFTHDTKKQYCHNISVLISRNSLILLIKLQKDSLYVVNN